MRHATSEAERLVDLRSDTVTRPTEAMRRAMASAEVGDDVWGDDPTARRLEERVAELLGKEAALFVPSGSMANLLAQLLHCRPGDEVIVGEEAHLLAFEGGAGAAIAGVQYAVAGRGGLFDEEEMRARVRPSSPHLPRTRLLALENTHNAAGGLPWPLAQQRRVVTAAHRIGLRVHIDGARLWNASVAQGVEVASLAEGADTVSVCFSKGLGAPVGSALAGPHEAIQEARRLRRRLGGGMRQVGVLCAAALHALEHHRTRLAEDHLHARRLAERLADTPGVRCDPQAVATNMVYFDLLHVDAEVLVRAAAERNVLLGAVGPRRIRAVTHLDVDAEGVERAARVIAEAASV